MLARDVANLIREDHIDILVELAGHTANNRLDVVALKPAPVQISYIGYNNTTGLGAVDYRITDAVVDPPTSEQEFSEELVRLPGCFLCYTPPSHIPEVGELPAFRNNFVTFGSFSCLAKIGEPCVALWARVMHEVPGSRLLVKNKGFYSLDVQATFINQFKAHGIAEHRLKLMALAPTSFDHLNIYNEMDVALDTFPYSNTTTSCETMLMGVPVVCLTGATHGSRVGVTLLTAIGLPDFVAQTQEEYAIKAKDLATNLPALAMLRQNLRQIMLSSPLCDGPSFMREKYEPMLMEKWRFFCEGRPPSAQVYGSSEPPDPLAPGPFAPALPPGVPLVQPVLPPSAKAPHPALPVLGNSCMVTASPSVPQLGAGPPLASSLPFTSQQQQQQQQHQQLQLQQQQQPSNVDQNKAASNGGVGLIGSGGVPVVPGLLSHAVVQPATVVNGAVGQNGHGDFVTGPATSCTSFNGVGQHGHGGFVTGPATSCTSFNGVRGGVQTGRRRPRARPQGRRF